MATRSLGVLTIDLIAKIGGLEEGLSKADRKTRAAMRTIETSVSRFSATVTRAFAVATTALTGFGAMAVKRLVDTNKELYQLSKRAEGMNVSVKFLSGMSEQADDLGIKVNQLAVVFGTLNRQIATAQRGSATALTLFKDFGVDPNKAKSTEEVFLAIADSVNKYGLNVRRAGELTQIFGASGKDIVPILKQGAKAIRDQNDAMAKTHQIITDKDVPAITALYNATDSIGDSFTALRNTLIVELAPAITDWAKSINEFVVKSGPAFADSIKTIVSHLDDFAKILAATLGAVVVGKTIVGIVSLASALRKLAAALAVVSEAAGVTRLALLGIAGTVGGWITVIAGAIYVYNKLKNETDSTRTALDKAREATKNLANAQGAALIPARQAAIAARDEAKAALQAAQARLAQWQANELVNKQAEDAARKAGQTIDRSVTGYGANAGLSQAGNTRNFAAEQVKKNKQDVADYIKTIKDLQKQIDDKDPALFVGLGGSAQPSSAESSPVVKTLKATKTNVDDVAKAYQALADASHEYANSLNQDDAQYKAEKTMRESLQNLAQLRDAYVKLTGDAATANKLFNAGLKGIKEKFTFDLTEPDRQLKKYTDSLNAQLDAMKQASAVKLAGATLSDHEADKMQELAADTADATKQISDFIAAHQLMNGTLTESDQKTLDALKDMLDKRHEIIAKAQQDEDDLRGNWMAGAQKAMANFIDQTNNLYQQSQTFIDNFASGFADAFTEFATDAKSAKDAFGDFIDDLYAQALRFVANQAISKFFQMLQNLGNNNTNSVAIGTNAVSTGGSGFWGSLLGSMFGGGRALGGPVLAGSMYRVNEQGPEMLSIGREDYLMMGNRSGHVTPASRSGSAGGTVINVAVQPTSTRRTAEQVATAIDRKQRIATARNG